MKITKSFIRFTLKTFWKIWKKLFSWVFPSIQVINPTLVVKAVDKKQWNSRWHSGIVIFFRLCWKLEETSCMIIIVSKRLLKSDSINDSDQSDFSKGRHCGWIECPFFHFSILSYTILHTLFWYIFCYLHFGPWAGCLLMRIPACFTTEWRKKVSGEIISLKYS